jgi:hypothetical protein
MEAPVTSCPLKVEPALPDRCRYVGLLKSRADSVPTRKRNRSEERGAAMTNATWLYLVGVSRQVLDRLLADRTLAFRRLPGNKHRRYRVGDVLLLAEERDRRQGGTSAIRCALREPAHRT